MYRINSNLKTQCFDFQRYDKKGPNHELNRYFAVFYGVLGSHFSLIIVLMDIYQLKHYLLYEMADKDSKNVLCTLHSCTTKESLSNDYGTP